MEWFKTSDCPKQNNSEKIIEQDFKHNLSDKETK
jgi:hypothetical protein